MGFRINHRDAAGDGCATRVARRSIRSASYTRCCLRERRRPFASPRPALAWRSYSLSRRPLYGLTALFRCAGSLASVSKRLSVLRTWYKSFRVYFVIPNVGILFAAFALVVPTHNRSSGAYGSEIVRAAIEATPPRPLRSTAWPIVIAILPRRALEGKGMVPDYPHRRKDSHGYDEAA